uniref:G_PROTEIN_RECEP_F1_2 domain-containing protein n=1 Tax=Elaeophora elaphi TaxID=1147741 RepID=A0A0R3RX32_9BILA
MHKHFKMILGQDPNDTGCVCSDLQHGDYSPAYKWFNYITVIILLPSISVFGVASNIVNIFVYSRERMRSSSNTYLLFLASSDFLVVITGLFIFWIDSARTYIPELSRAPYTTVYALPFGYMAQTCSVYFTVAAAIDCYIHVCWKTLSASYCTIRRACEINTFITVCSIIYNSLRFPQFNLRKCLHSGSKEIIIEICPTSLFFAINTIYNVYMYMVLMTLLPFLFLSILNAIIVVQQSSISRSNSTGFVKDNATRIVMTASLGHVKDAMFHSTGGGKMLDGSGETAGSDDSITMIMVVILFLCCNILALVVNVIETFFEPSTLLLNFLTDTSNFLVILNSSINCLIYYTFNKEYRKDKILIKHNAYHPIPLILLYKFYKRIHQSKASIFLIENLEIFGNCSSPIWQPVCRSVRNYDSFPLASIDRANNSSIPVAAIQSNNLAIENLKKHSKKFWNFSLIYHFFTYADVNNTDCLKILLDGNARKVKSKDDWRNVVNIRDGRLSKTDPMRKRWIAEIQIEHRNESDISHPHIYVLPLRKYLTRNVSITTL